MENLQNLEIIQINSHHGILTVTLSYQDLNNLDDINSGYNHIIIPVNIRELQLSAYGNILVDQSMKHKHEVVNSSE